MRDITALGEILIDFTPLGKSTQGNDTFEANPGGAPCNVLAMMRTLGNETAFIGKLGTDPFGQKIRKTLDNLSIDTSGLIMTDEYMTTMAFVSLSESGDRTFNFARKQSADIMLEKDEVHLNLIKDSRIFHCGSLSLTSDPARSATIYALEYAKANKICISVDPNLRELLWNDLDYARESINLLLSYADIIKISDYELDFLYESGDFQEKVEKLYKKFIPKILFITCGKNGSYVKFRDKAQWHKCYMNVKTIDTTGAGDAFLGACLHKLLEFNLNFESLTDQSCMDIIHFASAAAALFTTKKGALKSMPSLAEINDLLNRTV